MCLGESLKNAEDLKINDALMIGEPQHLHLHFDKKNIFFA